ncbi:hypothetical protein CF065_19500 [Clostridium sporogenes]
MDTLCRNKRNLWQIWRSNCRGYRKFTKRARFKKQIEQQNKRVDEQNKAMADIMNLIAMKSTP